MDTRAAGRTDDVRGVEMSSQEFNELKADLARRDALREIAACVFDDRMDQVVLKLVQRGVLPPATTALRRTILLAE